MQTVLADFIKDTAVGRRADAILRKCVHCGFCNATCPTYQLLGDELDGPRGRIYLMKQLMEGAQASSATRLHLDRCLLCRACETTCPSGVEYGALLEIGRELCEHGVIPHQHGRDGDLPRAPRSPGASELAIPIPRARPGRVRLVPRRPLAMRLFRALLLRIVPYRRRIGVVLSIARLTAPLLPRSLRARVPRRRASGSKDCKWPAVRHLRRMIAPSGCVQPAAAPWIDATAARYLDQHDISLLQTPGGCCGALALHLGDRKRFIRQARRNIDIWAPLLEQGAEVVVVSASGCAVTIKDYGAQLAEDRHYADRARFVAERTRDLCEVVATLPVQNVARDENARHAPHCMRVAVHSPCTLQHGQRLSGVVERIVADHGFTLSAVNNGHLCCGSAGAWSLEHPRLSRQLQQNKLRDLTSDAPDCIATANIGCWLQLQGGAVPVHHWVELLAARSDARC